MIVAVRPLLVISHCIQYVPVVRGVRMVGAVRALENLDRACYIFALLRVVAYGPGEVNCICQKIM